MDKLTEVAPDLYRTSTFVPQASLQFNQSLILNEKPLVVPYGNETLVFRRERCRGAPRRYREAPSDCLKPRRGESMAYRACRKPLSMIH